MTAGVLPEFKSLSVRKGKMEHRCGYILARNWPEDTLHKLTVFVGGLTKGILDTIFELVAPVLFYGWVDSAGRERFRGHFSRDCGDRGSGARRSKQIVRLLSMEAMQKARLELEWTSDRAGALRG